MVLCLNLHRNLILTTMDDQKELINKKENSGSNIWMYVLMVIMALCIIGVSLWLLSVKSTMKELLAEKEAQKVEIEHELQSLMVEHEKIKASYGEASDSLMVMDSIIQANAVEIKKMLNYKWEYYKIKKKLSKLQVIAQGYVRQMDSIVTVNRDLTEENIQIKEEIRIEKRKNQQLEKQTVELTGIVDEASELKVYSISADPIHKKGSGKEIVTDKIRRVDLVRICFTVSENSIVEPGEKTLYVRIAQPDKKILVEKRDDDHSFTYQGETLQYSIKEEIDYNNESMKMCVRWHKRTTQEMQPGLYHVDIFEGNANIGHALFELR